MEETKYTCPSELGNWQEVTMNASRSCWYTFNLCGKCWGEGRKIFKNTLWDKFLRAVGVRQ